MSRLPSAPHYAHPPPPQQMYYGHPNQPPPPPPISHLPPAHYAQDPSLYPFDRTPPDPSLRGQPMTWSNSTEGVYQSGPSRAADPYGAYPQPPHRASPNNPHPPPSRNISGSNGWSSIHPSSSGGGGMPSRPDSGSRGAVKLEDLVSQDRGARPGSGKSIPSNGPGGLTSLPLSVTHSSDTIRGGGSGLAGGSGAGDSNAGGSQQAGPSEFIKKLYKMLEEESAMFGKGRPAGASRGEGAKRGSVGWGRGGTSFVVWDMNEFTTKILPQTFRHSNFSSFVRQLNKYGFSKIKHVDEESGQIKENVWEFQHPNFQAGGKADLESIKRKAVVPKKATAGGDGDNAASPSARAGLGSEDVNRLMDMENRVLGLEDQLAKALDEVRDARTREMGMTNVMREVINHLAAVERGSASSPRDIEPSPRIVHLFQLFDQVASGPSRLPPGYNQIPMSFPNQPPSMPFNPSVRFQQGPAGSIPSMAAHPSPHTDGGSRSGDDRSPAASKGSGGPSAVGGQMAQIAPDQTDDNIIEVPSAAQPADPNQTLYNGEPLEMTPMFADTPAWLTEGTTATLPMYHRKSSDGTVLRIMMEALNPANVNTNGVRFEEGTTDPLDTTPRREPVVTETTIDPTTAPVLTNGIPATNGDVAVAAAAAGTGATVQQSPFGTLVIPNEGPAAAPTMDAAAVRLRRSTVIKPHWTQTPRILVVEDDVVYRQLSSKFLEKFGCVTETVEDAQGAVEKMNRTKYDLVLMDIFFGPSMDGRKATSLIRQFDMYTPIISMTSNVQTQDVDSYLQSGMNDVLAKPFTKHGLFGILDKHLIHLKAIQLSAQVPRSLGVPPLSDEGVAEAVATGAAQWSQSDEIALRNPLAAMGWSDDTYQIVLQQFLTTGTMPDVSTITNNAIGTSVVFGDSSGFNRKRSIEAIEDDWTNSPGTSMINGNGNGNAAAVANATMTVNGTANGNGINGAAVLGGGLVQPVGVAVSDGRSAKKIKK